MIGTTELKPCPFCGSVRVAIVGSFVRCGRCGAVGPFGCSEAEAAERWNNRPAEAEPDAADGGGVEDCEVAHRGL